VKFRGWEFPSQYFTKKSGPKFVLLCKRGFSTSSCREGGLDPAKRNFKEGEAR